MGLVGKRCRPTAQVLDDFVFGRGTSLAEAGVQRHAAAHVATKSIWTWFYERQTCMSSANQARTLCSPASSHDGGGPHFLGPAASGE